MIFRRLFKLEKTLLLSSSFDFKHINSKVAIPHDGGIYAFFQKKELVYVGRTKNLYNRIYNQHYRGKSTLDRKSKLGKGKRRHLRNSFSFRYLKLLWRERKALEHYIIAIHEPRYNDEKEK